MTTMAKVIRKVNKKAERQAAKKNRAHLIAEHNLTFDHQKAIEAEERSPSVTILQPESWNSPFKSDARNEALTLSQMFHLSEKR